MSEQPAVEVTRDLQGRCKEIARAREVVCDFLVDDNQQGSTAASLDAYFLTYAVAARLGR